MPAPDWLTTRPVAHRGLHDRARGLVENMPAAFMAAVDGHFAIELDLQLSADGEAMVHHDGALGRLNHGSAALRTLTAAELRAVEFNDTAERMISLGELCALVAGRVPLLIEVKSHFDGDRRLVTRMAEVLATYQGPVVGMSFDPDQLSALQTLMPQLIHGIIAESTYSEAHWSEATPAQRRGMEHLRHAFTTRPQFVSFRIDDLPAAAPWVARHLFGLPLLTWTVRTSAQRERATRYADQMIFEGFRPEA